MPATSREEHLAWAKRRALQYLDAGDLIEAFTSMASDLSKHPETKPEGFLMQIGMLHAREGDVVAVRRWIEGFN